MVTSDTALPSWNNCASHTAIIEFVQRVTSDGGADYVPPARRIAVFDNDGTLWCEQPAYAQLMFIIDRVRELVRDRPELARQPVVEHLRSGDLAGALNHGVTAVTDVLLQSHAGLTAEEFADDARAWLLSARHPERSVAFGDLVYLPMLELLDFLRANGFRVFVVTGGGVEFVRATSEEVYGIPPDDVIGSSVGLTFERREGRVELVRQPVLRGSPNEGEPKALNIQAHIGRRPILAAGNSSGDQEMLEYVQSGMLPSLCLLVDHDDAEREYRYAGRAITNPDAEPVLNVAARSDWTVVSMKNDWARIFSDQQGMQ
jgi:phosphoserine phosphatase